MGTRKRIGLCYTYNENWIGGTYYIENLISALNSLDDAEKPHIVLITDNRKDQKAAKKKLAYQYRSFQLGSGERNRFFQLVNKISGRLFHKKIFNQKIKDLDAIFPYYHCVQHSLAKKKIYWIADFQEHFASDFFSKEAVESIKLSKMEIQSSTENLVLSSQDALQHFKLLYPEHTVKVSVLPFAVTHPDYEQVEISSLLEKFSLPARYFICPNQFWKHKNQIVILQALNELKNKGIDLTVAFTGKTEDYRNPGCYRELKSFVDEHHLTDQIRFLGFIDRAEQLQLINNAVAIIQPSLFEGWSTVVEDAKALNKLLIVSSIDVHKEQLIDSSALFFDPLNPGELSRVLEQTLHYQSPPVLFDNNTYDQNIMEFGRNFLKISY
jgi:glycosyltransferase involved in cell wall biosynthesis